jgi:putative ABC transport system permease protein
VLLAGAGLMVKGFRAVFFIFEASQPEGILTLQTTLPDSKYKDQRSVAEFYRQVMERLKVLPQVKSASAASNTPLNNSPNPSAELIIEGQPSLRPGERRSADVMVISPDYFSTIKARVNSGRDFSESDRMGSPPVAIISETAARRYWPKEDPLGRRFKRGGSNADSDWLTIVGVVGDVKQAWFDREIRPQVYLSYFQQPRAKMSFLLRTTTDPMSVATAARSEVLAVDSQQPVDDIKTLAQLFADETSPLRFATWLMSVFGVIALILAAVGVYSVMSYTTAQRTREMGIRIAFGARSRDVLNLVLRRGLFTVSLGLGIGLPLALALGRIMSSLLFGVVPLEFGILIGLVSLMSAVALVATYIPARRAARVDPIVALRTE